MKNNQNIFLALKRILTPLLRILLRNGVSYSTFSIVAKETFVKVAMEDFALQGRKQSISRISILTGLHRKEVKAIQQTIISGDDKHLDEKGNRAARVISGWRLDPEFRDESGNPALLAVKGEGTTFETLVKRFSGNMPARAVLDELERVCAVERIDDDRVRLKVLAYVPEGDGEMKLHILGTDVGALIDTIAHNLLADQGQAYLQRKVSYDNLPQDVLAKIRESSKAKAQTLLDDLDGYLARHDRDTNPAIKGTGRHTAGIGIYYFEKRS